MTEMQRAQASDVNVGILAARLCDVVKMNKIRVFQDSSFY